MIKIIDIHLAERTAEQDAAELLRACLLQEWPTAEQNSDFKIYIIPNAKCFGQSVSDIDILVLLTCPPGINFVPTEELSGEDGKPINAEYVEIDSLVLTIEVKDHAPENIRFIGNRVIVHYTDRDHDASEQSHHQRTAVASYIRSQGLYAPYVRNLIWLRNILPHQIPTACANVIGANLTWNSVLQACARHSGLRSHNKIWYMSAVSNIDVLDDVASLFIKEILPTRLDRKRMERLSTNAVKTAILNAGLEDQVGKHLVWVRGRGGTGKTVLLLQLAVRLYERENARVLLLTYNNALVADLRRLMALSQLPIVQIASALKIQTVHSYLLEVCRHLGGAVTLEEKQTFDAGSAMSDMDFDKHYEDVKEEVLGYFRTGVLTEQDVENSKQDGLAAFSYDYVFIDEGQDWQENERDLLLSLFSHQNLVVADGIEQMVRRRQPLNWRGDLPKNQVHTVHRETCLRMKSNLARFVRAYAEGLNLDYDVPLSDASVPGGQVIIIEGDYFASRTLHDELQRRNAADGNHEVDMLFCVPPSMVSYEDADHKIESQVAHLFQKWGLNVWDGASPSVRQGIPTALDQHRIVQYDSCRGLEGWIVVAYQFDKFFDYKHLQFQQEIAKTQVVEMDNITSARLHAAFWTLIPITRAMDTLVIQIGQQQSLVRTALERTRQVCDDFVRWYRW